MLAAEQPIQEQELQLSAMERRLDVQQKDDWSKVHPSPEMSNDETNAAFEVEIYHHRVGTLNGSNPFWHEPCY